MNLKIAEKFNKFRHCFEGNLRKSNQLRTASKESYIIVQRFERRPDTPNVQDIFKSQSLK